TEGARGKYYHSLVKSLANEDSIITFNWDLLLDREFLDQGLICRQYANFFHRAPLALPENILAPYVQGEGLFLKLHGSLNWFRCGNQRCPSNGLMLSTNPRADSDLNTPETQILCWQCGSDLNPIIIPPLLRKPITDDPIIRSTWGLAKEALSSASRVVVVGFSAAPTDFYTHWLLRSTVGASADVLIEVINPDNEADRTDHSAFRSRMESIFLRGYGSSRFYFSQIGDVLGSSEGTEQ
ncbi:MAG: hypothetical protein ACYCOX_08925, partial [Acidobacteriaceae bacterium]